MAKQQVVALKVHTGFVSVSNGKPIKMKLPDGCQGMLFIFESKKTAREFWGKNCPLMEIELETKDKK